MCYCWGIPNNRKGTKEREGARRVALGEIKDLGGGGRGRYLRYKHILMKLGSGARRRYDFYKRGRFMSVCNAALMLATTRHPSLERQARPGGPSSPRMMRGGGGRSRFGGDLTVFHDG